MKMRITVEGRSYDVDVEILEGGHAATPAPPPAPTAPAPKPVVAPPPTPAPKPVNPAPAPTASGGDNVCKAPIAGNVTQIKVQPGQEVAVNEVLMVLEAMKMESNIASPAAGTVKSVNVSVGDAVKQGDLLVEFE